VFKGFIPFNFLEGTCSRSNRQQFGKERAILMKAIALSDYDHTSISCCAFKTHILISRFRDWGLGIGDWELGE
jgi:hypothetical protein